MKKLLFLGILCVSTIGLSLWYGGHPHDTEGASTQAEISGYAWSSNFGWISFKGSNYGVTFDQTTGILSGYAWSPYIGWISFNASDLGGCPTAPCQAKYSSNQFTGWAATHGFGFIHLSGPGYGLTVNNNVISGYMWSDGIGWIASKTLVTTPLVTTCGNGIDDDGDGLTDDADIDCGIIPPPPGFTPSGVESTYNYQCNNGIDDDGDGLKDYPADTDCTSTSGSTEQGTLAPEVTLKVGVGSPSFDTVNIGKTGGTVVVGIDIRNASSSTSCTGAQVGAHGSTPFTVTTGGATTYTTQKTFAITERTRIDVSCRTTNKTGSDSVDIILKSENEF